MILAHHQRYNLTSLVGVTPPLKGRRKTSEACQDHQHIFEIFGELICFDG